MKYPELSEDFGIGDLQREQREVADNAALQKNTALLDELFGSEIATPSIALRPTGRRLGSGRDYLTPVLPGQLTQDMLDGNIFDEIFDLQKSEYTTSGGLIVRSDGKIKGKNDSGELQWMSTREWSAAVASDLTEKMAELLKR